MKKNLLDEGIVLWGGGRRANRLLGILPLSCIRAVVDENPRRVGSYWNGIRVISKECYFAEFRQYPIMAP